MDTNSIFFGIIKASEGFIHSPFFLTLKLLLAIYVAVLFADVIMLLILRGFSDVRISFRGANIPLITKKQMRKKWDKIETRLGGEDISQYKLAILEADVLIDSIFKSMGIKGSNLTERLDNLSPGQMEDSEDLKNTHKVRNQIVNDPSFQIGKEEAKKTLDVYSKFLTENEFME